MTENALHTGRTPQPAHTRTTRRKIGEILVELGSCTIQDIEKALEIQQQISSRLGVILINTGILTEEQVLQALSNQFNIPLYRTAGDDLAPFAPLAMELEFLRSMGICPCEDKEKNSYLAVLDPLAVESIALIEQALDGPATLLLANEQELESLLEILLQDTGETDSELVAGDDIDRLKELATEAPVIKLVNRLISRAVEARASDIHFETFRRHPRVRYRIDGRLQTVETIATSLQMAVIARLKLISGMNIAENRIPQDGRISLRIAGKEIDIRASSAPTSFGESFVLRLLVKEDISYSLDSLGFYPDHLRSIRELIAQPHGICLTTGPTGSGKTTTLYSVLNELNRDDVKIITVEDPVEYELEGINQIQVQEKIDYTFANALRSILRQDPDIIMIGEIRDLETAEIAVQSSLTGHLVLSTLHTNSAIASIPRLLDMGIAEFLLKASISGLMAQRLVRRLCPHCKQVDDAHGELSEKYSLDRLLDQHAQLGIRVEPCRAVGCPRCNGSGYHGRIVIAEVIPFTGRVRKAFEKGTLQSEPEHYGCRSLFGDGLLKYAEGKTSFEEIIQVAG